MKPRHSRPSPRALPSLERLEARALLNVDFKLAFSIAGAANYTTPASVKADAAGNIHVAGQFQGTTEFGGTGPSSTLTPQGRADGFVAEYSPGGGLVWALDAKLAPTKVGEFTSIAVDSAGNTYAVGTYSTSVKLGTFTLTSSVFASYAAKIDPAGTVLWAKSLDSTVSLTAFGVGVDGMGDVYVTGGFKGKAFGGTITSAGLNGARNMFVAKLLPTGVLSWAVATNDMADQFGTGIAVDGAGTAYVAGNFRGTAMFGSTTLMSAGDYNTFVAKLNSAGTVLWATTIGGPMSLNTAGVAIDLGGNVFIGGDGSGMITFGPGVTAAVTTQSAYVAKFTGLGDVIWARVLTPTSGQSFGDNVVADGAGTVYLSGGASGTVDFDTGPGHYNVTLANYNAFVWKLDGAGRFQWVRTATGTGFSAGRAALAPNGKVVFAGYYSSPLQLGPFSLANVAGTPYSSGFVSVLSPPVANDFDGDGKADVAVLRPTTHQWLIAHSGGAGGLIVSFGGPEDVPVPGNYLGTGKSEIAVYRPSTSTWFSLVFGAIQFGAPGDIPVPADYDGDGKTDIAVFRPSTGEWIIRRSTVGAQTVQFGAPGWLPVPADYDGDGKTDIAAFEPHTAVWHVLGSTVGPFTLQFGAPGVDLPIPADYSGSGRASIAVYRPSTAQWLIFGVGAFSFGAPNIDVPVPADYLGIGHSQFGVYRTTSAQWFIVGVGGTQFGQAGLDLPLELPLVYRSAFYGRSVSRVASISAPAGDASSSLVVPIPQIPAADGPAWPVAVARQKRRPADVSLQAAVWPE